VIILCCADCVGAQDRIIYREPELSEKIMDGIQKLFPRVRTLGPTGAASPAGPAADTAADTAVHLSYQWLES
jgi:hypothetical protein